MDGKPPQSKWMHGLGKGGVGHEHVLTPYLTLAHVETCRP